MRIVTREFQLTLQEYFGMAFRRVARRWWWCWGLLIVGGKALDLASKGELMAVSFAAVLLGIALPIGTAFMLIARARRQAMAEVFRPRILEIDDQGFFVQVFGGNSYSIRWSSVVDAGPAAGGWEIAISDQLWFFVPSRAFEREAEFLAFEQWMTSGRRAEATPQDPTDLMNPPRFR
ncbi:MAG TPA: hypothetical protein PLH94_13475 [Fimbriimonadaceae bacterium]|nr:hypothetical protein [Fimbriimonadaceae bacterium]